MGPSTKNHHQPSPLTRHEQSVIYETIDQLRDAVRFSEGLAGYARDPGKAERLLRESVHRLQQLL